MDHPKELIEDIRNGKMVILVDDEDRENEGDLILAADFVSPEAINFMITQARGLVCLSLTDAQVKKLNLYQMIPPDQNRSQNQTAFTVSIEASDGVSTGISAADRAHTIRVASHPNAKASEVSVPGHIFPIKAQPGGVLKRAGHTEGSVDLARLAGLNPAAVICEVMNPDGTMARVPDLQAFAKKHGLKMGSIVDLIEYRLQTETFVEEVAQSTYTDAFGDKILVKVFKDEISQQEHLAFIKGGLDTSQPNVQPTFVRVHAQNTLEDLMGGESQGRQKIENTLRFLNDKNPGVFVYIQKQEDLKSQVTYQEKVAAMDHKNFGVGAQILKKLGLQKIKIITDSPQKPNAIKAYGIEIVETLSFSQMKEQSQKTFVGVPSEVNL